MGRHVAAAIDYYAAHDYGAVSGHAVDERTADRPAAVEEPLPEVFEGLSVPVRTAASLLGLSPWAVAHLIERGELRSERGGQYRYVTLTSIFSYRRLTR
ncbi:hypothetical protein LE181_15250 [Streptomyces sp. SCA3-4]|uniref:hypothetical protein n=1 Tax=Streptomyces sichuanensis TaxID=2871810 RepID=UPI001CE29B98|nr:hypothetical protein [Streptomyces sichuanensis]MCA6093512.1 hypothetical protein [Streptomyces sichuanensis]